MKQYNAIKTKHPDALLLFRVGDFYETFGQDAIKAASVLGIVLTKRHNGSAGEVELAGFPHHSLDSYLPKLVRSGLRVAVCDQLEDPKATKGIVKRGVTELVTPGVTFSQDVLEQKQNNFLASVYFDKTHLGISFLDVSTGEFNVGAGTVDEIEKLIQQFRPSEIVYCRNQKARFDQLNRDRFYHFALDDWVYSGDFANETLCRQFQTKNLKGFGIENLSAGQMAAGAILQYLSITQNDRLQHVSKIKRIDGNQFVWLDEFTIRNLELIHPSTFGGQALIDVMDKCSAPMGSRMMRKWLLFPLIDQKVLNDRHEKVNEFLKEESLRTDIQNEISEIGDLERLLAKVSVGKANPRELQYLKNALGSIERVKSILGHNKLFKSVKDGIHACKELKESLDRELNEDAPVAINKGGVISTGVNAELDELRTLLKEGKQYLLDLQVRESETTGISSLKVAYNNVFGYYIEVRNTHKDKVPEEWIRKQTLVNAERYITEELKEYESKILGAEEKILEIETALFARLIESVLPHISDIQETAHHIAELDCLISFAQIAIANNYVRPKIIQGHTLDIQEGRHPVIEQNLPIGESYVSNNVYLSNEQQQILMITGPNMSGKSALLRQTALIAIMAQMGSFVPANHVEMGIIDKVFTRVGASDNISQGESTFMVEMNETASILNNISNQSLILLDEIGRGTATYDGVSIAWSIAEFLHENGSVQPKTLFATHYHELNEMHNLFPRIANFNVSIKELDDKVIFLRKLKPGGSEHSFGIHVAKMAGMPVSIIQRANEVLKKLEASHVPQNVPQSSNEEDEFQLSIFQLDDPTLEQIKEELTKIDINNLTPVEALMKLNAIKQMVGGK